MIEFKLSETARFACVCTLADWAAMNKVANAASCSGITFALMVCRAHVATSALQEVGCIL